MKRTLSFVLALVLLIGLMPIQVLASENEVNPWEGRSAVFVGDSITYGVGTTKPYYEYLDESLGFSSVAAMGVSGSCFSTASNYGTTREPLITRYQNIPSADLIVVFMGTNDYGHETPLGTENDTEDGTFYGALNVIIPALVSKHTSSKIVFVTSLHRYGYGTSEILGTKFTYDNIPNGVGATLEDYVNAVKTVCAKNGVSVIDLFTECPLDPTDAEVRSEYMPDGVHPNAAGHEVIAGIMESHIRTFEPEEDEPVVLTEMIQGNKYASSSNQPCRASSRINYYLKAGTVITLKNPDVMQWACARTSNEYSSNNLGYFPEKQWTDIVTAEVAEDGWIGFTFKYRDETQVFDLTKPLSDYISIEEPHTHFYNPTVTVPTCTKQGYTTYTCTCGDSYVDDYVDATGHNYENGTCTVCGAAHWDTDGDGVLEILAIGNSFSVDALQYAYQIAQNLGIEEIVLGNLYIGGCTLATHAANAAGDLGKYTYYYNDNGTWTSTGSYKISTALESRSWDYVSMQQGSPVSGVESSYNEDLTNLIAYVQERSDAKLVWHMTWAYQQNSTHSAFPTYNKDQMTMYNAIVSSVQNKIVTNSDIDLIVPNGTAVQNSRTSLLGDTTTRDGYHMSKDYGRYLTGLLFIKTVTGLSVDNITYAPSGVDAEEMAIAIESVNNAAAKHFEVTQSAYVEEELELPEGFPEGYILLETELYKNAYWHPMKEGQYNALITGNSTSEKYYATIRFTKNELPVGSIIVLADGWQYRPDGWITDAVQTGTREPVTTESYVVITEEWWGDYTIRAFNISKVGSPSLANVSEEAVRAAFRIYVPEEKHVHVNDSVITAPTCTDKGYTTHTCTLCGNSSVDSYTEATGHGFENGVCIVCGELNYILLQPELYQCAYWNPIDKTQYNVLIGDANNSNQYFATMRFTRETLPVGSIIVLENGWQYRPDGWITDTLQTGTREPVTNTERVVITEEWWGDYTIRSFNISKIGLPSLENVAEEDVRAAFQIYVPEASHNHTYDDGLCTLCGDAQPSPVIIQQPVDGEAKLGERYMVEVKAEGEGLKYQWYFRNAGSSTWYKSSVKDNTYDDVMTTARAGREVYCVITDANGNSVTTDTVKLICLPSEELAIVTQPTDGEAVLGERYCVTVEAKGEGLKYQWYFRNKGAKNWTKSSVTDNTYDDVMTTTRDGREVYCVITDLAGNKVTTDIVKLVRVPMKLEITSQPTDATAAFGEMFCATVKAKGEGLKYQWYYRNAGSATWHKSGVRDNTYDDVMTKARNGREVYCVITDKYGNSVTTDIVKLIAIPKVELKLLGQTYESAAMGERYCVTVEAQGEGLTYQWYFRNAGSSTWYKSSVKDNTYDDVMTKARANREVYCVITDAYGNQIVTEVVTLVLTKD